MPGMEATVHNRYKQTLSQTEQYVLTMSYSDDLTPEEIALVLDMPTDEVESVLLELQRRAWAALQNSTEYSMATYSHMRLHT